jgi:hypothetical protein
MTTKRVPTQQAERQPRQLLSNEKPDERFVVAVERHFGGSAFNLRQLDDQVYDLVRRDLRAIATVSENHIRKIKPRHTSTHGSESELLHRLVYFAASTAALIRVMLFDRPVEDSLLPPQHWTRQYSHLVAVVVGNPPGLWKLGGTNVDALVTTTKDQCPQLVADILVDIAMYHSYSSLSAAHLTKGFGALFMRLKTEYILKHFPTTYYGSFEGTSGYTSFAAACRSRAGLNHKLYVEHWDDFVSTLSSELRVWKTASTCDCTGRTCTCPDAPKPADAVDRVRLACPSKIRGQIGLRQLANALADTPQGVHILARTASKPRMLSTQREILALMQLGRWKTGRLRVFPASSQSQLLKYSRYLQLVKFTL